MEPPLWQWAIAVQTDPNIFFHCRPVDGATVMATKLVVEIGEAASRAGLSRVGYFIPLNSARWTGTRLVRYYIKHGSCMYMAYLDASKAFDRVNQNKLFKKLLNNGVPKWIINVISQWYCNQTLCVKWGSVISDEFLMYADYFHRQRKGCKDFLKMHIHMGVNMIFCLIVKISVNDC